MGVQEAGTAGPGQPDQGVHILPRGLLQDGVGAALVDQQGVRALMEAQAVPQPVPQSLELLPAQGGKQAGIGGQGLLGRPGGAGRPAAR